MMERDPQQQAIDMLNYNLAVVAGAGSGKTYVLVERFLALLRAHRDWRLNQVVAITFTRAAALEMRERVRQRLVMESDSGASEDWRAHARRLIEQMDSARIDTIHGLCANLLRANAAEAGLDPDFVILEEVESALLANRALDQMLRSALRTAWPPALLIAAQMPNSDAIIRTLRSLIPHAHALAPCTQAELLARWSQLRTQVFSTRIRHFVAQAQMLLSDIHLPAKLDDSIAIVAQDVQKRAAELLNYDSEAQFAQLGAIQSLRLVGGSAKAWGKEELNAAKAALTIIREEAKQIIEYYPPLREVDGAAAELSIAWAELVQRAAEAYQLAKNERRALDFNDLEERSVRLLDEHSAVRERYRNQEYKQILVDEFQDTNEAQWRIIERLTSLEHGGSLFVVGDPKQSIYGFRGADVRVFEKVQHLIESQPSGDSLRLQRSWRSHPGLVESFNSLFERILRRDPESSAAAYQVEFGEAMSAVRQDQPASPSVELVLLRTQRKIEEGQAPEGAPNEAARRTWEAHTIGQHILRLHAEGFPIQARDAEGQLSQRPFQFSDAALLFQSMSSVNDYEEAFKDLGIPYITIAGKGFYNRQEIRDAMNLVRALHNPADDLALAAALRSPFFAFSDEMLLALRLPLGSSRHPELLWTALHTRDLVHGPGLFQSEELARLQHARHVLSTLQRLAGRLTIDEVLRRAIAMTGYLATITALPAGDRRRRNVEKLLDVAEASKSVTVGAFSEFIAELNEREVREGEAALEADQAVRLMTVHASKGLEFPVVYLANASWRRSAVRDPISFEETLGLIVRGADKEQEPFLSAYAQEIQRSREDAESRRKLYVAMTRARDLLIICAGHSSNQPSKNRSATWKDLLFAALSLEDPQDQMSIGLGAGTLRIHIPAYSDMTFIRQMQDDAARYSAESVTPAVPPLLKALKQGQESLFGHISATQLARLGEARYQRPHMPYRALLSEEGARANPILQTRENEVTQRLVGEIVHEAIRYWRFPHNFVGLAEMLQAHAWSQHLTRQETLEAAAKQAETLLEQFRRSSLYAEIEAARQAKRPVLREVPFVFRSGERLIHGIIDVLFQDASEAWTIADYKTSYVPREPGERLSEALAKHAERYYFQIGAYASAVEAQYGGTPRALLHYIRYNTTLTLTPDHWRDALLRLQEAVSEVLQGATDASLA